MGEAISVKKSDLTVTEEGLDVFVPEGKTGQRRVLLIEGAKYVTDWLQEAFNQSKDSPVWVSPRVSTPLQGPAIAKRLGEVKERLNEYRKKKGIPPFNKSVNPHNFRHSAASEMGASRRGMTEAIMNAYFGWKQGSSTCKVYLHLNQEKIRQAVLATRGKAKLEETVIIHTKSASDAKRKTP